MSAKSPVQAANFRRECGAVMVLTVLGAIVRLWQIGRLGLVHFDEGIYALAGLWIFSPAGFAGIDPSSISYAPPGLPFLIGLSYLVFGVGDLRGDSVSIGRLWHDDDPGRGVAVAQDVWGRSRGRGGGSRGLFGPSPGLFADGPDRCLISPGLASRAGPGPAISGTPESVAGRAAGCSSWDWHSCLNIMAGSPGSSLS